MAERLITPEDFTTGAPPRIMGTEAEDHVNLRTYSEDSTDDLERNIEDIQAINTLLSLENFNKAGITARAPLKTPSHKWLTNGQKLYPDGTEGERSRLLESCTAEQLGPTKALAGTQAGTRVVRKLVDASGLDVQVFRRSGTVNRIGHVRKAGFHMNHITLNEVADLFRINKETRLNTHAATRLYSWEGMVAPNGFTLSQKAHAYRNKDTFFYKGKDKGGKGFGRIEDYSGEDSSPWGTFMAMATTSVLLRVIEHPEQEDLNQRFSQLKLKDAYEAIQRVSADMTLNKPLPLADGRHMTAIQIQTELAAIAQEFSNRFALPDDEQFAIEEWQRVCKDLEKATETGALKPLAERIGWVSKKRWLEKQIKGEATYSPQTVLLDMSWDSYYPKEGGRLLLPQKTGLTIASEADVQYLVSHPPQDTRAVVRGAYLDDKDLSFSSINWGDLVFKRGEGPNSPYGTKYLPPYKTI